VGAGAVVRAPQVYAAAVQFLYHRRPPDLRGETLYPLGLLKSVHPDLHELELAKYAGREALLDLWIPLLEVRWNDAVHLCPLHPSRLASAWRAAGIDSPAWEHDFFRIPVARLEGLPAVWFSSGAVSAPDRPAGHGRLSLPSADVSWFDGARYRELDAPPARHLEHLRERREQARRARPFAFVPHALVGAPLGVAGLELVRADGSG
jgi:hypothetical protein